MAEAKVVEGSKTPKRGVVRKFFKSFVDVKKWVSYDEVKSNTKNTWGLLRRLLRYDVSKVRNETYEEAVGRLGLNQEQIAKRQQVFLYSMLIYGAFALVFFSYFVYLIFNLRLLASIIMLILVFLMLLATYRESFWYMQMRKKKLGCNFKEWLDFILRRGS